MAPDRQGARRFAHAQSPPDGGSIEDEIALGARIDRRGPLLRHAAALPGGAGGDHFQTGQVGGWIAVVLPANEPRNGVASLHARAFEQPVLGVDTNPVAAAIDRTDIASTHQVTLIGTAMREGAVLGFADDRVFMLAPIGAAAEDTLVRRAGGVGREGGVPADAVDGEKMLPDRICNLKIA